LSHFPINIFSKVDAVAILAVSIHGWIHSYHRFMAQILTVYNGK